MNDRIEAMRKLLLEHGQMLDSAIAIASSLSLEATREVLQALAATGEVVICRVSRFEEGRECQVWQCRTLQYNPFSPSRRGTAVARRARRA